MMTRIFNRMRYRIFIFLSYYYSDVVSQQMSELVNLQISIEKDVNGNFITLNCTSMEETFDDSAEFIIDNITRANIRTSHGACYILRRVCAANECACTSRMYIWTFLASTVGKQFHTLTCQLRFQEKNINSHVQVYKTKIYNGSDFYDEKTSINKIPISNSNATQDIKSIQSGSKKFLPLYIAASILIPLIITVTSCLVWKWIKGWKIAKKDKGKPTSHNECTLLRELRRSHTSSETPVYEHETQENSAVCLNMSDESANIEGENENTRDVT